MKKSILILALTAMITGSFALAEDKGKKCTKFYPTDSLTADQAEHYAVKNLILKEVGVPGSLNLHIRGVAAPIAMTCATQKRTGTSGADQYRIKAKCDDNQVGKGYSVSIITGGLSARDIAVVRAKSASSDSKMVSRLRCEKN